MIFASDLDRTLIYSKRFLENVSETDYQLVETYNGRDIAYAMNEEIVALKELNEKITFVPVTTRTQAEFKRIQLMQELNPKYAIVANGGKILIDGQEDKEWTEYVEKTKATLKYSAEKIKEEFLKHYPMEHFTVHKLAEELFWMFRLENEMIDNNQFEEVRAILNGLEWELMKTGHKMYLLPAVLTKWNALEYIQKKIGDNTVVAAGDSLMDLEMVSKATYGITPAHGEINELGLAKEPIILTPSAGIQAGLDIVNKVKQLQKERALVN